jgi:hypothetical protein
MARIHRTLGEQEVTFRYDQDEREAWFGTTTPWVARRWQRAHYPVRVLSRVDGQPTSWEVKLPWDGHRRTWLRAFGLSLPKTGATSRDRAGGPARSPTNGSRVRGRAGFPVVGGERGVPPALGGAGGR